MSLVDSTAAVFHVLFAGLWTGAIVFFAWRLHPLLVSGQLDREAAAHVASGLQWLTRVGALVFLATGGHMAANRYDPGTLFGTGRGHLVLAMLGLWFVLTGVVEGTAAKLRGALENDGPQVAGEQTEILVWIAALLAVALLVVGGLLVV